MTDLDEDKASTLMKLMGALEDDDDVQNVFSNFEVSDEVMAKLTAA
jgi:transcriptional/translational regulatory protein YebC/TACO1